MEEHLRDRVLRRLEQLPDERAYQVLDYVEFLESRYANRSQPDNIFTRITEKVEDTLRAGKAPIKVVAGTVGLFDGAAKVVRGLASAAQSVVEETTRVARDVTSGSPSPDSSPDSLTPPESPPPAQSPPGTPT